MQIFSEKNTRKRVEILVEEIFSSINFALPKLLQLFERSNAALFESLKSALVEEISIIEIETKVRKNCQNLPKKGKNPTPAKSFSSNRRQQPARRFVDGDKKLIVTMIRDLSANAAVSLKLRSKTYEEDLLGVKHRKSVICRDLSGMCTRLENRLILSGFGAQLKNKTVDAGDGGGFFNSPRPLDEYVGKFKQTLETFLGVFFFLNGKSFRFGLFDD